MDALRLALCLWTSARQLLSMVWLQMHWKLFNACIVWVLPAAACSGQRPTQGLIGAAVVVGRRLVGLICTAAQEKAACAGWGLVWLCGGLHRGCVQAGVAWVRA